MKPLFVFVALAMTASPLAGNDRLAIRISPSVAFAPANLVVRTMVAADKDNRSIEVIAESPQFYRSSEIQLDGEHAPRTTVFQFRAVPSGDYLRFRLVTQYGSTDHRPEPSDVINYLSWCRHWDSETQ